MATGCNTSLNLSFIKTLSIIHSTNILLILKYSPTFSSSVIASFFFLAFGARNVLWSFIQTKAENLRINICQVCGALSLYYCSSITFIYSRVVRRLAIRKLKLCRLSLLPSSTVNVLDFIKIFYIWCNIFLFQFILRFIRIPSGKGSKCPKLPL